MMSDRFYRVTNCAIGVLFAITLLGGIGSILGQVVIALKRAAW